MRIIGPVPQGMITMADFKVIRGCGTARVTFAVGRGGLARGLVALGQRPGVSP
jgi:hypothetical protein